MSSSRLIAGAAAAGPIVRIEDVPPYRQVFRATYAATEPVQAAESLPRNWTQVELLVEARLQEFEARHRQECQESFELGRLEGRRECQFEVTSRLEAAAAPWRTLQAAVLKELADYRQELYRGATELAAALSRAWLGHVVEVNPHVFEAGLRQALDALGEQEHIEVRLHPEDYARYCEGLHDPLSVLHEAKGFTLQPDPQVDRGGALARARGGTADARIAVRVQKALEWLNSPHEPR